MSRWRLSALSLAAVALFAVAMHWPVLREGRTVSAFDLAYTFGGYAAVRPPGMTRPQNGLLSDTVVQFQAWDVAMFEGSLRFPWLWNPYAGFGSPLLANSQAAPLFPLKHLVYPLTGVRLGFGVVCLLKMALAGALMWLYLRSLRLRPEARAVGALAFMGCGFMVAWLQWPHTSVALFLPALLWGAESLVRGRTRQGFALVAGAVALGALGGHPETLFHVCFAAGLYLLVRVLTDARVGRGGGAGSKAVRAAATARALAWLAAAGLAGALVGAVQLLPTLEYLRESDVLFGRAKVHEAAAAADLLSPGDPVFLRNELFAQVLPETFGNPSRGTFWWNKGTNFNESAGYVGIGVLALSLLCWAHLRRSAPARALAALQAVSLAFVVRLPLIERTLGAVPPFDVAANKRMLLVFCCSSAALAAVAVHEWRRARRPSAAQLAWLAAVVAGLTALAAWRFFGTFTGHPEAWVRAYGLRGLRHFAVFLALSLLALALLRVRRLRRAAALALPLVVAADIHLIHYRYNPFLDPDALYPATPALEFLQGREQRRVLPVSSCMGPNILAVYGLEDPRIYDAVTYRPLAQYLKKMRAVGTWRIAESAPSALTSIAGIRHLWAGERWKPKGGDVPPSMRPRRGSRPSGERWTPSGGDVALVWSGGTERIYEDRGARPPAYLAGAWKSAGSTTEALRKLTATGAAASVTVVEGAPAGGAAGTPPLRPATVVRLSPTRVRVELPGGEGGLLVLNDSYFPGWTAAVDGRPAPILRANGVFRGVVVGAGAREVEFRYAPASFRVGAWISALTLAALLAAAAVPAARAWRQRGGTAREGQTGQAASLG